MSYKIYLDKEETFECEVSIKNASSKDSSARLIIESEDVNLVFYGKVTKDTITVPIKILKKYFTESDKGKIKLEVIVENNLITPWESELEFESYNKVEIKEIKNIKHKPLIEVKVKEETKPTEEVIEENKKTNVVEEKVEVTKQNSIENKQNAVSKSETVKEVLLQLVNEEIKKINTDGKLSKTQRSKMIKNLLKKVYN